MPKTWEKVASEDDIYKNESDYKSAAYQLITAQVLYESDQNQRGAYHIIRRHSSEFKEALSLFGLELLFSDEYRYCAAVPKEMRKVKLPLQDTLLILVMRQVFHERASRGELDAGQAIVTIEDLSTAFNLATGYTLPTTIVGFRELVRKIQRFGLAKCVDNPDSSLQPFDIAILPAIIELVNEAAASRLGAYHVSVSSRSESKDIEGESSDEAA